MLTRNTIAPPPRPHNTDAAAGGDEGGGDDGGGGGSGSGRRIRVSGESEAMLRQLLECRSAQADDATLAARYAAAQAFLHEHLLK